MPPSEGQFGTDRHLPEGDWIRATGVVSVVGIPYRKQAAQSFADAVRVAERKGLHYGLSLEPEPDNPHDPNAIAVHGVAETRGLLRTTTGTWHIGYLPRDLAADIHRELLDHDVPIAVELYRIFEGDDGFLDVKAVVLAPRGFVAARERSAQGDAS